MAIDFTCPVGQVRALINDTDEDNLEFPDEQLELYIEMSYGNILLAAILAAQGLVAKYSASAGDEYRLGDFQYREGKSKASFYQSLLNNLKQSIEDGTSPIIVGVPRTYGIYTSDRKENEERIQSGELIPPRTSNYENNQINLDPQKGPYYP